MKVETNKPIKKFVKPVVRTGGVSAPVKRSDALQITLPTELSVPSTDIRDYSFLIHGDKKIGKTTLLAQEEGTLFLTCDPEQKGKALYQMTIEDRAVTDSKGTLVVTAWAYFVKILAKLEQQTAAKNKCPYRNVVIDGIDLLYDYCFSGTCKELGINHPNEEKDYGQSWKKIKDSFRDVMLRLLKLKGCAIRLICHSQWKDVERRDGSKGERLCPLLGGSPEELIVGLVDACFAYTYVDNKRILIVQGDERVSAGHRIDGQFRTPDGTPIEEIPMGSDPEEAYSNFVRAFNNQQPYTNMQERQEWLAAKKNKAVKKGA